MSSFHEVVQKNEAAILSGWIEAMASGTRRGDLMGDAELKRQTAEFLRLFTQAAQSGSDQGSEAFQGTRDFLKDIAKSRMDQGFSPAEVAMFVLSLKQPLFNALRSHYKNSEELIQEVWASGNLIDKLAMLTVDSAVQIRNDVIARQQAEMLELSTPVVKLWDGVLALPLIGTLDSARTQVVMESLLSSIVATNSQIAIIDITGVPTVDTLVAQHLIKTITAARLMGAECYLSGIRPAIAQTIVHLGIDLADIQTKANLADAFGLALGKIGKTVVSAKSSAKTGLAAKERDA
jgi:rsbT co-antagonist protein RsbR